MLDCGVNLVNVEAADGGATAFSPASLASTVLYQPSTPSGWIVNSDGTGAAAAIDENVGYIAAGKVGTPHAAAGNAAVRKSNGLHFVPASFSYLDLSSSIALTGPFTFWWSGVVPGDTPRMMLIANSATPERIEIVSGFISVYNPAGTNRATAYAPATGAKLIRVRRDASNLIWIAATGLAEVQVGASLSGTWTYTQIGYSQGAGGGYAGTNPRHLGRCLCNVDLVTDSPSDAAAVEADFFAKDGVSL